MHIRHHREPMLRNQPHRNAVHRKPRPVLHLHVYEQEATQIVSLVGIMRFSHLNPTESHQTCYQLLCFGVASHVYKTLTFPARANPTFAPFFENDVLH